MPNPWIGLVLTTLLLARLLYRFMVIWPEMSHMGTPTPDAWHHSPLTMAFFGLWFGYYVAYYAGVLLHHRHALMEIRSKQPV